MSSLVFRITGDPASFKAAMGEVSGSLDATGRKAALVSDVFGRMGSAMTLGVTVPVVAMGAAAVRAAADMEKLNKGLASVMGSTQAGAAEFKKLQEAAKLPGLGLEGAVQGSIRLQVLGKTADESRRLMAALGNSIALVGGGKDDFAEVTRQIGQMLSVGKVTKENLDTITERIPQISKIMIDLWGPQAVGDPAKFFEKAGISSKQFWDILLPKLEGGARASDTFANKLGNLEEAVKQSSARIGEKLLPAVEKMLPKLEQVAIFAADMVDAFTKLPGPVQNSTIALAGLVLVAGPLMNVSKSIIAIGAAVGINAASISAFSATMMANGVATNAAIGLMAGAWVAAAAVAIYSVASLTSAFYELYTATQKLDGAEKDLGYSIELLLSRVKKAHPEIGAMELRYRAGTLSAEEFSAELRRLAGTMQSTTVPAAKKTGDSFRNLAAETAKASNVIKVTSVAMRDANGELSKTSLVYVESLERVKTAVGKVKDVMYEYITAGTLIGKTIEMHPAILDAATLGAQEYAARLGDIRRELENMPATRVETVNMGNLRRGSVFETDDILGGASSRNQQARVAQAEADLARIKQLNAEGKATGNDVITAQQNLKKAIEETGQAATTSGRRQTRALQQVSTVLTDLSRGIGNAGIGLIFDKPKVDAEKFKNEIAELEAEIAKLTAAQGQMSEETARLKDEESKLIAAQAKGHNVQAQLAVVRAKIIESEKRGGEELIAVQNRLAEAQKRMGEELHKASFGFRALQAGKAVIEDLAKSIVRTLIEGALTSLSKKLFEVGGIMGKVFGGASGPGGTIFSAASGGGASAAGSATGGIGSSAGSAGTGISGIVSAVSGVVSAVSGVIGNFQFAHMNTALGRIEESTRFSQIHLLYTLEKANEFWPELRNIHARLIEIRELGVKIEGGGVVNNFNFDATVISDHQLGEFTDRQIRLLKARGVQFA